MELPEGWIFEETASTESSSVFYNAYGDPEKKDASKGSILGFLDENAFETYSYIFQQVSQEGAYNGLQENLGAKNKSSIDILGLSALTFDSEFISAEFDEYVKGKGFALALPNGTMVLICVDSNPSTEKVERIFQSLLESIEELNDPVELE